MDFAIIPRTFLYCFDDDPVRCIHLNILFSHLLLFIIAGSVIYLSIDLSFIPHICLFQHFFGIPCPGCGITRSLLAFFVGDFQSAWMQNPVGPILGVSLVAQIPIRILALCSVSWSRRVFRLSRVTTTGIICLLMLNWIYQIT
jgi:hypothetical protein